MNARNALVFAAAAGVVGAAVALYLKQTASEDLETPHSVNPGRAHARVTGVVKKTLDQHQGEESPVVQAFQEALQTDKSG